MTATLRLVEFCHVLRGLGVRVSTAEMLDAAEALSRSDWAERKQIKAALQATLIKRLEDVGVFNQAFAAFFSNRETRQALERDFTTRRLESQAASAKADAELTFQGNILPIPEELKQVYGRISSEDQQRIRDFLAKTSGGANVQSRFQPIAQRMVTGSLEYWRRQLAAEEDQSFPVRPSGDAGVDQLVEGAAQHLQSDLQALLNKDMQRVGQDDVPLMLKLIRQLVRLLSGQISRRQRRTNLARRLDLRRTIRHNLRYGGLMLNIKHKTVAKSKPKVLLLCDVSGSMARYAVFVLQFMYGLSTLLYNIESFIFAEDVERMTAKFRKKEPFAEIMSQVMAKSAQWGKGTDLRASLASLRGEHKRVLQPATVVIILSDAKTLHGEAAAAELAALAKQVKKVIWLNTVPVDEWPRHKTIALFRKYSRMVPCNTLADLAGIVRSELFRVKP